MRHSLAAAFCCLLVFPFTAFGLGLGDIRLGSSLSQPFAAEIPLESYEPGDLDDLKVTLASEATFERYGLDQPAFLRDFAFALDRDAGGNAIVRVTSLRPVTEPFVTLLLDVRWPAGRLLREYTVLLDPPLFESTPVQPAVEPARSVAATPAPTQAAGAVARDERPQSAPAAERVSQPAAPEPAATATAAAAGAPTAAPSLAGDTYNVQRRDTLWGIAERVRGNSDLTVNQVMLALYRANPDAFLGNINRLKAGAILRVPDSEQLDAVSPAAATAAVREQNAALQAAAPAAAEAAAAARLTLVAPDETASATDAAPVAGRPAGDAPTQAANAAESQRLQSRVSELEGELSASRRALELRDAELAALQRRIQVLERDGGSVTESDSALADQPLDEVLVEDDLPAADGGADAVFADESATLDEGQDSDEPAAGTESTPAAADAAESRDTAATAANRPADAASTVVTRESEPSFFGELLGSIWFWVSAAVVLLLALFMARRGRGEAEDEPADWDAAPVRSGAEADHADTMRDLEALESRDDSFLVEESDYAPESGREPAGEPTARLDELLDEAAATDAGDGLKAFAGLSADTETPLEKTTSIGPPLNLDQADPIAEAEFHMAYGLYDQAADLLEKALADDPDNRAFRTKLIEVFFVWENRDGFLKHARLLHDATDGEADSDWNKVVILGKQLCPDESLFSGAATAAPTADSMDFEFGDDSASGNGSVDFTLSGTEVETLDESSIESIGEADNEEDLLDFDLGGDGGGDDELALNLGEGFDDGDTMESPTVEADMADAGGDTMETPTVESPAVSHGDDESDLDFGDALIDDSASTMETPTVQNAMNEPTVESPTLETSASAGDTSEMPALDPEAFQADDIDLDIGGADDLDVDLSGLTGEFEGLDDDSTDTESVDVENSATAEVPALGDTDATMLAPTDDDETLLASIGDDLENRLEAEIEAELDAQSDDTGSDTVEQPRIDPAETELGDTAEQPVMSDSAEVDFDLGMDAEAEDDIATAIEEASLPEDATMTEVGTKLDLARAYIDMGDPDGARSILNEVLDEGGDEQQQEARQLLEELDD